MHRYGTFETFQIYLSVCFMKPQCLYIFLFMILLHSFVYKQKQLIGSRLIRSPLTAMPKGTSSLHSVCPSGHLPQLSFLNFFSSCIDLRSWYLICGSLSYSYTSHLRCKKQEIRRACIKLGQKRCSGSHSKLC